MRKTALICLLIICVMASAGCSGNSDEKRMEMSEEISDSEVVRSELSKELFDPEAEYSEMPKELFDPEDAFSEIPHDSFEAVWLDGSLKSEDSNTPVYEETYHFVLSMDRAVIPYTVSGTLIQTCEYSPAEERWNVDRRVDNVLQEMDLSTYHWTLEDIMLEYIETFVKNGPNTFATGEPDQPSEPYFTVDILAGGVNLKDEEGITNLPGGQWTARLYIESPSYPGFKGEAAIDLIGGSYAYKNSRWIVPISELKRVEKEQNMTDEDRMEEEQEVFRQTFPGAAYFEVMDASLADECNRELSSSQFGNVGVNKAALAKSSSGGTLGWVVQTFSEDSFGGDVIISVAIMSDGSIDRLEFLLLQDTAGLGLKARDEEFKGQFTGKHAESLTVTKSGNAGDSEIDAISGATITSNAVTNAVNAALYYVRNFTDSD